ncbi:MAG: SOS response-associated peptidase [Bacteroidetes bacterium]|nr:SOS response-associated peptidase [Bacteroidota bacterium]
MCYSVAYLEKKLVKLAERYKEVVKVDLTIEDTARELPLYYFVSGFSFPELPVITAENISLFQWGLIPSWAKDEQYASKIRTQTLNAVGETVFEKPSFRNAVRKHRGLLPVNGFFEWKDVNKVKYPYFISLKEKDIFSLGCIYDTWIDKTTGETKQTFSIITTPANNLLSEIHNTKKRMPLIIHQQDEAQWIDSSLSEKKIAGLTKPFPDKEMKAHTVSREINNPKNNRNLPFAIEAIAY